MLDIAVVLVEPARGGNVGASARAMKTMGFTDLRLVTPEGSQVWNTPEARSFAHGAGDVLETLSPYPSLNDALADRDLVVGTTARRRGKRNDYYTPRQLQEMLKQDRCGGNVALVFGREESGLSNAELELCHVTTAIPMRAAYPSLNLSQAVMVYCYELAPLRFEVHAQHSSPAEQATMSVVYRRVADTLLRLGFDPGRALYRRILERVGAAGQTDAHLILSVVKAITRSLDRTGGAPALPHAIAGYPEGPRSSSSSSETPDGEH